MFYYMVSIGASSRAVGCRDCLSSTFCQRIFCANCLAVYGSARLPFALPAVRVACSGHLLAVYRHGLELVRIDCHAPRVANSSFLSQTDGCPYSALKHVVRCGSPWIVPCNESMLVTHVFLMQGYFRKSPTAREQYAPGRVAPDRAPECTGAKQKQSEAAQLAVSRVIGVAGLCKNIVHTF